MNNDKVRRVLHVVKIMNHGGAETMIMNFYRNIDRNKIQFDFLCMDLSNGEYYEEIKKMGGNIYIVDAPEKSRIKNLIQIFKLIKRIKKKENLVAVHSHISFYSGYVNFVAWLAGIKIRISHSHTTSDLRKIGNIRKIYNGFSRLLISMFSNVKLACGEKAGKYLYKSNKFEIINNGIDLDAFTNVSNENVNSLKRELNIEKDSLIIGNVARIEEVKNQQFLISIAKALILKKIKFKIVIVGNGSLLQKLIIKISKENLEKYFIFTGLRTDINIFMNLFDVFFMPSLYEGFPLVVAEALAGNNICYLSDTISNETNVIESYINYFNLNDSPDKIVERMLKSIENKDKVNVKKILKNKGFSIKDTTNKISNIYLR